MSATQKLQVSSKELRENFRPAYFNGMDRQECLSYFLIMSQALSKLSRRLGKTVIVFGLIAAAFTLASAQKQAIRVGAHNQIPTEPDGSKKGDREEPLTVVEEEMKAKRAIKEADKEYQENLERARDLSSLGVSIVASFKQKQTLDREDIKKLEKFEKLAKGIRNAAGGSDDKVTLDKSPKDLAAAMDMLSDLSQSLKEKVEKTPKRVISAAVIDEANVLLELIRLVRTLPAKV
ncbi:MAG TPA: hypothetical protein VGO56_22105 [Pyrinomonadaceae bacterium]|jgi:hypothetical protein|nr:hypothetical protein [Pyrinomonadaceae bacterium]